MFLISGVFPVQPLYSVIQTAHSMLTICSNYADIMLTCLHAQIVSCSHADGVIATPWRSPSPRRMSHSILFVPGIFSALCGHLTVGKCLSCPLCLPLLVPQMSAVGIAPAIGVVSRTRPSFLGTVPFLGLSRYCYY